MVGRFVLLSRTAIHKRGDETITDVTFSCDCGRLRGVLHDAAPRAVCHLICYCKDCRAFARHMGQLDALEPGGGSPLVQVAPSCIEITEGADQLACLRLSPKGLLRWYAKCCNTPLANTVSSPKVPLAGMWRAGFSDVEPFGPVVSLGFTKMALPGGPGKDRGLIQMLSGLAKRTLSGYMSGTLRNTPFFAAEGATVVAPTVLTAEERVEAYAE